MATRRQYVPPEGNIVLSDPRAIRALAHPARLAVIDELGGERSLTATEAAQIAGLSPSAMSYHLRALAKWGIVREAGDSADGRERRWELAGKGLTITAVPPSAYAATAVIAASAVDRDREALIAWSSHNQPGDEIWQDLSTTSHSEVWLTEDEAADVSIEVSEIFERFRGRSRKPADTHRVRLGFLLIPIDDPPDRG